jgi:hypothetical protein
MISVDIQQHISSWSTIQLDNVLMHLTRLALARHLDAERLQNLAKAKPLPKDILVREQISEQIRSDEEDAIVLQLWNDVRQTLPLVDLPNNDSNLRTIPPVPISTAAPTPLALSLPLYDPTRQAPTVSSMLLTSLPPLMRPPTQQNVPPSTLQHAKWLSGDYAPSLPLLDPSSTTNPQLPRSRVCAFEFSQGALVSAEAEHLRALVLPPSRQQRLTLLRTRRGVRVVREGAAAQLLVKSLSDTVLSSRARLRKIIGPAESGYGVAGRQGKADICSAVRVGAMAAVTRYYGAVRYFK